MIISQAQLQTARELIEDRHYEAARALLETMPDDPTARKWLRQLEKRERPVQPPIPAMSEAIDAQTPTAPRPAPQKSDTWMWVVSILAILIVIGLIGFSIYQERTQGQRAAAEYTCGLMYERYSTQWQNCVDDRR